MGVRRMKDFNKIFPTEMVSEILTRLPTESVLECKSVCKTWNNLISHPSFPQRHLARLNHLDSGTLRYVSLDLKYVDGFYHGYKFYYFKYNDNEDWNYVKPVHRDIMSETIPCENYIVIGSFNGLICVYGYDITEGYASGPASGPAIIFNPVIKEYISLPNCNRFRGSYEDKSLIGHCQLGCGFGYLVETNEYKVVRLFTHVSEPSAIEVEVYTVGSHKGWRHVGKFEVGIIDLWYVEQHAVFLNGALHWRNAQGGGMVLVFDLADEKFRQHIPPPPLLTGTDDDDEVLEGNIVLGVSGGGILYYAVGLSFQGREINDVWLWMKKNGHQSWGWSKAASLDQRKPFAFMKKGTVLRYDEGTVKRFISLTSTWENLLDFNEISRQVYPHKHTLVSLKELGETDVRTLEPWEPDYDCCFPFFL